MKPIVIGAVAGYVVWTILWLGGGFVLAGRYPDELEVFQAGGSLTEPGFLGASLVLSVICSLVGGFTAARLGRNRAHAAVMTMAVLLLLTGIGVQASAWSRMPLWYHLVFLVLIIPVCLAGGRRRSA